jgi:hypothetical protein
MGIKSPLGPQNYTWRTIKINLDENTVSISPCISEASFERQQSNKKYQVWTFEHSLEGTLYLMCDEVTVLNSAEKGCPDIWKDTHFPAHTPLSHVIQFPKENTAPMWYRTKPSGNSLGKSWYIDTSSTCAISE